MNKDGCMDIQTAALGIMMRIGALLTGHFAFASGRHGSEYFNKDALYPHVRETKNICQLLVAKLLDTGSSLSQLIQVVAAPEKGGSILSQWVAHWLNPYTSEEEVLAVYAEKEGDGFVFRRGYGRYTRGRRVLVVEDTLTTGGSARKTVEAVRASGGDVLAVACLWNRGNVRAEDLGVPTLVSLVEAQIVSWAEDECPLCERGMPFDALKSATGSSLACQSGR